jgi:hypothetical protein
LLHKYYNNFKTGTIRQNHVFCMSNQYPDLNMNCVTHDGAKFVLQLMLKRRAKFSDERRKEIQDYVLETLKAPRLQFIKQVEVYWAETCPKPTDKVIDSVSKERANKLTTKNNNDAEKVEAKERNIVEAVEKKEKGAASRTQKKKRGNSRQ